EHTYSAAMREAAYEWFAQWLGSPRKDPLPEWEDRVREPDDVRFTVTDAETVLESAANLTVGISNSTSLHSLARRRGHRLIAMRHKDGAQSFDAEIARQVRGSVRHFYASADDARATRVTLASRKQSDSTELVELLIEVDGQHTIPGIWVKPAVGQLCGAVLYLHEDGYAALDQSAIEGFMRQNLAVLAVDVRGLGMLYPRASKWDIHPWCDISRALSFGLWALGNSVPHLQTADALAAVEFLASKSELNRLPIYVVGVGRAAPIALIATAMRDRISGVVGVNSLVSYANFLEHKLPTHNMMSLSYGVLKEFDIPEMLAAVADRIILWSAPIDAMGETLSASEVAEAYRLPRALIRNSETVFSAAVNVDVAELLSARSGGRASSP
ncbi:MAG TPA: hypothetical protein PKC18_04315, partial [Lacipirellulaceae bacterium]|nr:hypothetical protein [Lacipirellulaceae bacterium]